MQQTLQVYTPKIGEDSGGELTTTKLAEAMRADEGLTIADIYTQLSYVRQFSDWQPQMNWAAFTAGLLYALVDRLAPNSVIDIPGEFKIIKNVDHLMILMQDQQEEGSWKARLANKPLRYTLGLFTAYLGPSLFTSLLLGKLPSISSLKTASKKGIVHLEG